MKFLALFVLPFGLHAKTKPHNDNIRAGEYAKPSFSPWTIALS
jgi:hypothetical protein